MASLPYAELHCHTHFSFLDGASAPDDLAERAAELGLAGLAVTDHNGLYGAIRFTSAAEAAGVHPVIGIEVELLDAAAPDPFGIAVPGRRAWRPGRRPAPVEEPPRVVEGRPVRPRPERARLPGHREVRKEDHRGIGEAERGPHLVLLARDAVGWRSLCRLVSRANLAGTKAVPRFTHELLAANAEGLVALSGCRHGEIARRLRAGDREGARAAAERYARLLGSSALPSASAASTSAAHSTSALSVSSPLSPAVAAGFVLELSHHLLPDDDWLASETARLAAELGLPTVVTNDVHYARPDGRELHDVLTAIRHGRTLAELRDLRRPDGESYLKGADELMALPPGDPSTAVADPVLASSWREGMANSVEIAAACRVELTFERYRFPGFEIPKGETPFSHLSGLCWDGARRRYHPFTPAVMRQLAHELDVIEKTGLAEFFLICWDLMRFAKSKGIPAQGRGSAADSIVAYVLGITRVDPIRHELLFERFINEGRTAYPDVDIDFSSARREEVIQYVYGRYGPEHTGMVCNLVTYRARSAVREVGYALGFPRPLVDRVAKALETYDSVMVRRDLEAEGGFAQFFARPGEEGSGPAGSAAALPDTTALGLTDAMGQLRHARGGRLRTGGAGELGDGRLPRTEDRRRAEGSASAPLSSSASAEGSASAPPSSSASALSADPRWAQDADRRGAQDRELRDVKPGTPVPTRPERWLGGDEADRWLRQQLGAFAPGGSASMPEVSPRPPSAVSLTLPERGRRESGANPGQVRPRRVNAPESGDSDTDTTSTTDAERGWGLAAMPDVADTAPRRSSASSGTWEGAPGSAPAIRGGGPDDDRGGPGDSPASVAWLRAGRGTGYGADAWASSRAQPPSRVLERDRDAHAVRDRVGRDTARGTERWAPYREAKRELDEAVARRLDPETGVLHAEDRRFDPRRVAAPETGPGPEEVADEAGAEAEAEAEAGVKTGAEAEIQAADPVHARQGGRSDHDSGASSVARLDPPLPPAGADPAHRGSVAGLSDWERWLELCARIDGFPRHLSIHSGGMLVTAAPLIDIAPVERATMKDRVVVQYDKRDVEAMKLIKLDLLGLGMLAAIDETVQLVGHDCAVCLDLDRIPEEIPEVFAMLQAADTVGVFQVESRAQMQTLPKSKPRSLDDLVVEVAIIRPGPIQGNAVHPYLRRKQGLEPVTYLHPSLEPILHDTLGVILYQEQVMKIAIDVAGFSAAGSDGFRRAMGTYRSKREMDRLHDQFVGGCQHVQGMPEEDAEELFRRVAAFASFGFAKSHAAAFARTAYESSFLKLFYPAQFTVGLINAQPMGFYPVEVLVNDAKRHGVAVLPTDVNASAYRTTTEWVGRPGWALAEAAGDDGSRDGDPGEELPESCGVAARPRPVRSPACLMPSAAARERWAAESAAGWGIRLGLHLVNGIGEEHAARLDEELAHGPYRTLADVVERTSLAEEVVERLIRAGALDSLGRPRRELLWQLREVAGASKGRVSGRPMRGAAGGKAAGRPMGLRLPPTEAPALPPIGEAERLGDAYAVVGLDAKLQAVALFRDALGAVGAVTSASLAERRPGPVRIAGLVVTRQHPMTARGTVFLALEDETGMVNVTLWPDAWQQWRSIVRRHALLLVDGDLQREGEVVNVIARRVEGLVEATRGAGGPTNPQGVRQLGMAGMRRLG